MYSYNEQIEQAFLGNVLIDNAIMQKTILVEEDFEGYKTKKLFQIFKKLIDNGEEITPLSFKAFIDTQNLINEIGYEIIFEISEAYELGINYKVYEKGIKNYVKDKKIKQIKESINENNLLESIKQLSSLEEKKNNGNGIIELCNSFEEFRDNFKKQGGLGYKGPYAIVDKYVGGIIPGKVYTIVAYSGVGKSNFSYSYITDALKKGKKVVVFSLEVQKEMLFNSLLKSFYNVNQRQIMKDDFVYDLGDFENLIVYDNIYKLQEIKLTAKNDKPDIIFIDFIQNIQVPGNSEYEKMTVVAQELQQLAIETNITIFNISQANNESRFKDSGKIQPKGSGAIFASSDIIFALSRDDKNLQLNLLKNKYGPSDKNFVVVPDFRNIQFKIAKELQLEEIQNEQTDYLDL